MRKFLDDDGDTWTEQPDGRYQITRARQGADLGFTVTDLDSLRYTFGPLTEIVPEVPTVTRAEFAEFLGDMCKAFHLVTGGPTKVHYVLTDWHKRMGA